MPSRRPVVPAPVRALPGHPPDRLTGFRVRACDKAGALLATYGTGGDQAGVTFRSDPNVGEDGRLWVIDLDSATQSYSIKVLE